MNVIFCNKLEIVQELHFLRRTSQGRKINAIIVKCNFLLAISM